MSNLISAVCSVEGCGGKIEARGWCKKHYARWFNTGTVVLKRREPESHGHTGGGLVSPEYAIWDAMAARCYNPNCASFKNYGGRGITVCDRWRQSFSAFIADVGRRPSAGYSIERIDNNGNYEPGNVKWATITEQRCNQRRNHRVTFRGQTKTLSEWVRILQMNRSLLQARLSLGWTPERAFTEPSQRAKGRSKGSSNEQI